MTTGSFERSRISWRFVVRRLAAVAAFAAILAAGAQPGHAAMSADQIKRQVEGAFGVRVLKVSPMQDAGVAAFAVVIMNAGGDFNEAWQVNTIVVDAASGKLIRQFRHRPSGISDAGHQRRDTVLP
jgi:hypothetical protein